MVSVWYNFNKVGSGSPRTIQYCFESIHKFIYIWEGTVGQDAQIKNLVFVVVKK